MEGYRDERLCKILEQLTETEQNILWLALGFYLKNASDLDEGDKITIHRLMASLEEIDQKDLERETEGSPEDTNP